MIDPIFAEVSKRFSAKETIDTWYDDITKETKNQFVQIIPNVHIKFLRWNGTSGSFEKGIHNGILVDYSSVQRTDKEKI